MRHEGNERCHSQVQRLQPESNGEQHYVRRYRLDTASECGISEMRRAVRSRSLLTKERLGSGLALANCVIAKPRPQRFLQQPPSDRGEDESKGGVASKPCRRYTTRCAGGPRRSKLWAVWPIDRARRAGDACGMKRTFMVLAMLVPAALAVTGPAGASFGAQVATHGRDSVSLLSTTAYVYDSSYSRVGYARLSYSTKWNVYDSSYSMAGYVRQSYSTKWLIFGSDYSQLGFTRQSYSTKVKSSDVVERPRSSDGRFRRVGGRAPPLGRGRAR